MTPPLPAPAPQPPSNLPDLDRALEDLRRIEAQVIAQMRPRMPPPGQMRPGWPIQRVNPG